MLIAYLAPICQSNSHWGSDWRPRARDELRPWLAVAEGHLSVRFILFTFNFISGNGGGNGETAVHC